MPDLIGTKYYTIITDIGQAKIANTIYSGKKLELTLLKLGDGNGEFYNPESSQTDIKKEVWRGNVVDVEIDEENPNWINIYTIIPPTDGGYYIREMGVFDSDGDMIGICNCAETYKPVISDGSAKEITMKMTLAVVNTSAITLKVDPTVIYAKRKDVLLLNTKVNDIEAQLKDIANDKASKAELEELKKTVSNIDLSATKVNLTAINGMSAKNVQTGMQELFTFASNGKSAIAGKVGNVTGSNTHTEIANRIQTDKNTAATNLSNKGVSASGNEALASLVGKIENISVEGMGGVLSSGGSFNPSRTSDKLFEKGFISLPFRPNLIHIYCKRQYGRMDIATYSENRIEDAKKGTYIYNDSPSFLVYYFKPTEDYKNTFIKPTESGFNFIINIESTLYGIIEKVYWTAYKLKNI